MNTTEPLARYVASLPDTWKWDFSAALPRPLQSEWQEWLAAAQRHEEASLLRYWRQRRQQAA